MKVANLRSIGQPIATFLATPSIPLLPATVPVLSRATRLFRTSTIPRP
jgi:hypothetical protein